MPVIALVRRVPFTARQMFDVVADVERYPQFVPLCESLVVTARQQSGDETILTATMRVGYKSVREGFTTRVLLRPAEPSILVEYLDGPFSHLENRWRFVEQPGGSDVDFHIDYVFRSTMLALLVGSVFDTAFRKLTDAFEQRAHVVYGDVRSVPQTDA